MTGPRGQREGELDPQAVAVLRAFRAADDMPAAAQERVWARLSATAGPETWPADKVRQDRSRWAWAAVVVAAAAALLLASRAGVLGPLVGARGGEAASYAEQPGAGSMRATPTAERVAGQGAAAATITEVDVSQDMMQETEAEATTGPEVRRGAARATSGPGRARPAGSEPRAEEARARPRAGATDGEAEPAGTGSEAASTLAQEAEALARAQAAIQGGRAEEALAVLADYAQRFSRGALREEHDALRALALCASGRRIEGRGEAKAFLSTRGGSALAERVRRGCLDE